MPARNIIIALSRFLLIGWASIWIAALPLFHTHLPGTQQQPFGVPHTIFSADLPGEYLAFDHKTTEADDSELSVLLSNSSELGFVASWEDGKRKALLQHGSLVLLAFMPPMLSASDRLQEMPRIDPKTGSSPESHGFRAPPVPVSS